MKRLSTALLILLLIVLPAQAETWFPDVSGTLIHRDPFCTDRLLTPESFVLPALQYPSRESILAEEVYAICPLCDVPSVALPAESELYYNPDGGTTLHHDPYCGSVSGKYLPLTNITEASGPIPQGNCYFCGPRFMHCPADIRIWACSMEEKTYFLPGVWTLPSANAITPEEADDIARSWAEHNLSGSIFQLCVLHYDYGLSIDEERETYKVIVTTELREPVCLLALDAITGEIYAVARPVTSQSN